LPRATLQKSSPGSFNNLQDEFRIFQRCPLQTLLNRKFLLLVLVACGIARGLAASAQSADAETERFLRLTQQLEVDPFADSDKSKRSWRMGWVAQSKEVVVVVCDLLGPVPSQDLPYKSEILTQMLFGNAAFQIANPKRRSDVVATQVAGVRSAIKAYAAIVAKRPQARIPYFEKLLREEQGGNLQNFLAPMVKARCSDDGPSDAAGVTAALIGR